MNLLIIAYEGNSTDDSAALVVSRKDENGTQFLRGFAGREADNIYKSLVGESGS